MSKNKWPHDNLELIRRVLGNDYLELSVDSLAIEESLGEPSASRVRVEIIDPGGNRHVVEGRSCGVIDALWSGFLDKYAREYQSLQSLELASFQISAQLEAKEQTTRGSKALGEVTLGIRNSEGLRFSFVDESRSIVASSVRAVVAAIQYFINAERAFIMLHTSLSDARERGRTDLVARYTQELAEVVKSTSYAEVIENLKKDLIS